MAGHVDQLRKTFLAGSDMAPNRRVKITDATTRPHTVGYADSSEAAIGYTESVVEIGRPCSVKLVSGYGTIKAAADDAITANTIVYAAADGRVSSTGLVRQGVALDTVSEQNDVLEIIPGVVSDVSLAPSYDESGYTTLLQYRTDYREEPSACVSFISDDGFATDIARLYPIFAEAEKKFATAVTTNLIGTASHMTLAQLQALQASGLWECLSHQKDHTTVAGVTDEDWLEDQIAGSRVVLEALGFDVESYVACYNASTELARKWVARTYRAGFSHTWEYKTGSGGSIAGVNVPPIDAYRLCRVAILGTEAADIAGYEDAIDDAIAKNGWVIFYTHEVSEAMATVIENLLAYAAAAEIDVVSVSEALDRYENIAQFGELDSMRGFMVGCDGSVRTPKVSTSSLIVAYEDYPWSDNWCEISYDSGDLRLDPESATKEVLIGVAAGIRPRADGTQTNGRDGYSWKSTSTKEVFRGGSYGNRSLSDKQINTAATAAAGATVTKTFTVGTGSKILGIAIRNYGAIGGATSFDAAFTAGVSQAICSGAAVTSTSVAGAIFDANAASPISTTDTVTVTFTANGGNFNGTGQFYCTLWYQAIKDE